MAYDLKTETQDISFSVEPIKTTETENERFSRKILDMYKMGLERIGITQDDKIRSVFILGSFGRYEGTRDSDMDPWIVCSQETTENLNDLSRIANQEMNLRRFIGEGSSATELSRHKASIFSTEEAVLYRKIFPTRVGVPSFLGEHFTAENKEDYDWLPINNEEASADFAASIEEFRQHWTTAQEKGLPESQQKKWIRRMAQEIHFRETGERFVKSDEIDSLIIEKYGDDKGVVEKTESLYQELKTKLGPENIERRSLAHQLMWTLEKVRWELIDCQNDPQHLENWRLGQKKNFGFFPTEIGDLITKTVDFTSLPIESSKLLGQYLVNLTRETYNPEQLNEFYKTLCSWINNAAEATLNMDTVKTDKLNPSFVLPALSDGIPVIRRVGINGASQLVSTEAAALLKIDPERIVKMSQNEKMAILESKDLGGHKLDLPELESRIPEYTSLLKKLHSIKEDKFGRISGKESFSGYGEYLFDRLNKASMPEVLKQQIESLIEKNQSVLIDVQPVLCHMDSGPRNLIIDQENRLQFVDFEHASACAAEWDIERVLLQLPSDLQENFEANYYSDKPKNEQISLVTKAVMVATFASKLPDSKKEIQDQYYDQVKNWITI